MFCSKNNLVSLLFVCLIAFSGCKKDDTATKPTPPPPVNEAQEPLKTAEPGTIRARVNGKEKNTIASATDAQTTSIVRMEISGSTEKNETISIVFPAKTKPGNYDSIAVGRFIISSMPKPNEPYQDLVWVAGSAKLTITKYDSLEKKISGTFSFDALPRENSDAMGGKQVKEGSFTDVYIR